RCLSLLVWGCWLAAGMDLLNAATGIFHVYYVCAMQPALAALVGIGSVNLTRAAVSGRSRQRAVVAATLVVAGALAIWLALGSGRLVWLTVPAAVVASVSGLLIAPRRFGPAVRAWLRRPLAAPATTALVLIALFWGPGVWSFATLAAPGSGLDPQAAHPATHIRPPANATLARMPGPAELAVIGRLETRSQGSRWVLAVDSSMVASPLIIATGEPIMAMGGYNGSDPILDRARLAHLVRQGAVRYFLVAPGSTFQSRVDHDIGAACRPMSSWRLERWSGTNETLLTPWGRSSPPPPAVAAKLYDCRGRAQALRGS
ncbi:MAG: hypothetical protein ACRDNS_21875, partial [Trebonia sp.]